jgi:hypothetical protein
MNTKPEDTVSLDEAFTQIDARRRAENPWTAADEERYQKRAQAEREAQERWDAAHPAAPEEEDEEDEEDEESPE